MSDPRKHHYVPQFYLKRWAGEDRRVSDYRRFDGKLVHRRRFPSETGFEIELYSVRTQTDPTRRQAVEKRLMSRIDNAAARALDYMDETLAPPDDTDRRNGWTRFLLSLIYRSPTQVARLREKILEHRDGILAGLADRYDELRAETDPETFEEYVERDRGHIDEESFAVLMNRLTNSEWVGTTLIRMTWGVMAWKQVRHGFLTGDIPIMISDGLGHRNSFVMLPIGPSTLFIAATRREVIDAFANQDATTLERAVNDAIVRQARQVVITRDPTQHRFIDNRLLRSPPPTGKLGLHTWNGPLVDVG